MAAEDPRASGAKGYNPPLAVGSKKKEPESPGNGRGCLPAFTNPPGERVGAPSVTGRRSSELILRRTLRLFSSKASTFDR